MITSMRRYRWALQIGLIVVVAAFVVSSVVVFGSGTGERTDRAQDTVVATVNGEPIPVERFERRYRAYYDNYQRQYQDRFSPEVAEVMGLSSQVVSDLVQEAVIVQRARSEKLELTDEELNTAVHAVSSFQDNGRFSLKRYEEVLRDRGFTKTSFENDVRRELTRNKVESTVRQGVKVTDAEVEQAYVSQREEVRAMWALIDLGVVAATAVIGDEELQKYLDSHQDEFRQPLRRKVQMVGFPLSTFNAPVPQEEIEKYYAEHQKDFETPHQVKASHVLFRVDAAKGKEAEDAARAKAVDVLKRLKSGQDFAKVARELSEDPASAKNGGDLGWVSKGEMVAPFENAIFGMKKGETSTEPVQTTFGFHVIRVTDVKEPTKQSLAAATNQIRARLAVGASEKAARAKADEIRAALLNAKDFMAEAQAKGLSTREMTVNRSDRRTPSSTSLEASVFELAIGGISQPVRMQSDVVILKVVEEMPARVPPLADVKDKVTTAVRRQKAEAQAAERAKQVAADARAGDFAAAARKAGAKIDETGRFSRSKPPEKLPGDVLIAALQTPVNAVSDPVKAPQGYYVVKVLERIAPDMSGFAAEREKLAAEVLHQKQGRAWEAWISDARANAKIDVSPKFQGRKRG